jgi:enamine deaminase RidA (YjgF/YER057c/UK114 family)
MSPHRIVTAPRLAEPSGYAHAVVAEPGTLVYLGGQTAEGPDGAIHGRTIVEQFDVAVGNVVAALAAAGGRPEHLVYMTVYVTDVSDYRASLRDIGGIYRRHLGRHYPAMALVGVNALFDDAAKIELVGVAVIPQSSERRPRHGLRLGRSVGRMFRLTQEQMREASEAIDRFHQLEKAARKTTDLEEHRRLWSEASEIQRQLQELLTSADDGI